MDHDIVEIVAGMDRYVRRRGTTLGLEPRRLCRQIIQYVDMRHHMGSYDISYPQFKPYKPAGWTSREEGLWRDWIQYTFSLDSWQEEVIGPVFGTDVRSWEPPREGWRAEIMEFLPWWIARSLTIVDAFDPSSIDPEDEELVADKKEIDPYLLDHGSSKQKYKQKRG